MVISLQFPRLYRSRAGTYHHSMSMVLLIRGYRGLQVRNYIESQMTLRITNCSGGVYSLGAWAAKSIKKYSIPPSRG